MNIRIKSVKENGKENFIYEVEDKDEIKTRISVDYLDSVVKILNAARKKVSIRNAKAFEKFLINIKRATKYFDKMEKKAKETPNILHLKQDNDELGEYYKKYIKYDKKAQALFSLHNGWYENLASIVDEIKTVLEEDYNLIDEDKELLYMASRIDGILDKYRKKQKSKTL